jgi:hypothetical protein
MGRDLDAAAVALASIGGFSDDERKAILAHVEIGHVLVGPGGEGWAPPVTSLVDRGFTWSEFDRWQAFFTARGLFPHRWDGLQVVPTSAESPAMHVTYRLRKLELLLEWLDTLRRQTVDLRHYARQGRGVRIVRQDDGHRCPVCESFNAREVTPGTDATPPLHPGCRCVLMAAMPAAPRERLEAMPGRGPRSTSGQRV